MLDGRIVNRDCDTPIPDDEPIFLLRAKDRLAIRALTAYFSAIEDPEHARAVAARLEDFKRFARDHPGSNEGPARTASYLFSLAEVDIECLLLAGSMQSWVGKLSFG